MLRQLAIKGNGLSCEERQVHGAAVSVGPGKAWEESSRTEIRQAGSRMHPLTAGSYSSVGFPGSAALSKAALPELENLLD